MTVDLGALEALDTFRHREEPTYTELVRDAHRLASALESTLAELRQEREQAETLSRAVTDLIRMGNERANERDDVSAALSRAEETIEAARAAWWSATEQGDNGLIYTDRIEDAMDEIWTAIGHADYDGDKQKEADRD